MTVITSVWSIPDGFVVPIKDVKADSKRESTSKVKPKGGRRTSLGVDAKK